MQKVTVTGVTGIALKTGTWTTTTSGNTTCSEATGPAKACLVLECGTVEVDVAAGQTVKITLNGTDAVVERV